MIASQGLSISGRNQKEAVSKLIEIDYVCQWIPFSKIDHSLFKHG